MEIFISITSRILSNPDAFCSFALYHLLESPSEFISAMGFHTVAHVVQLILVLVNVVVFNKSLKIKKKRSDLISNLSTRGNDTRKFNVPRCPRKRKRYCCTYQTLCERTRTYYFSNLRTCTQCLYYNAAIMIEKKN